MLPVLGIIVVLASVLGGFALENGRLAPLAQPAEVFIICGSAVGTLMSANSPELLRRTVFAMVRIFRTPPPNRKFYLSTMVMLFALFEYARRNGPAKLEDQLDHPDTSVLFRRHASAVHDSGALEFICDTLRLNTMGQISAYELDTLLELDFVTREHELAAPANTLATLADALPGLGILSAVLGVVITMSSLQESPASIGQKVGSALIGTFLGIFLSYGFAGPLAAHLERLNEAEVLYYQTLRAALAAFARGMPVSIAVEFGRRAIPPLLRPGFVETEQECRRASGKVVENFPAPLH